MTITLTREEAQQVLDALLAWEEESSGYGWSENDEGCVALLRARLAQPEPKAKYSDIVSDGGLDPRNKFDTAPPKREWQGLTDEEAEEVERWVEFKEEGSGRIPTGKLIRYIEAKLKEKNG